MSTKKNTLFCYGFGYCAQALARILPDWKVIGTTRNPQSSQFNSFDNVTPLIIPGADLEISLKSASHLLISAAPDATGDPLLKTIDISKHYFDWVGYLSTTGVYGDHNGAWVDEATPTTPSTIRGNQRVNAENAWLDTGLPVHIFRLAGIYGPGRGPFAKVKNGTARRIIKEGQVFSRIHVEDIAQTLAASITSPKAGSIYNVCDNDPAPPQDVIAYAAELLNLPVPKAEPFESAEMSAMAQGFYAENKRVRNSKITTELGVDLKYPSYRDGLTADLKRL
ncbi:MAG: SDR family oxidoreductase [Planktomarina sp.]